MIEPGTAFADLSDNAALAEALLKYTFAALLKERNEDLAFFDRRIEKGLVAKLERIVGSVFVHMNYDEAIGVLDRVNEKFEFPVQWGVDLQSEHERYLTEKYAKKPVIVMNYPKAIKAFYMRLNDDGRTVAAMDVLAPGIGEIIGGSQRQERLEVLDRNSAASTGSTTPHPSLPREQGREGWRICAATARWHAGFGLALAFAGAPPATRGIEARYFSARVSAECQGKHLARPANRADHVGITHRDGAIFP
jgi:asparaginyl-tRNA synthetase